MPPKTLRKITTHQDKTAENRGNGTLNSKDHKAKILELYNNYSKSSTEITRKLEKEHGIFLNRRAVAKIINSHDSTSSLGKGGRPSKITPELKDTIKSIYLCDPLLTTSKLLIELRRNIPGINISTPTLLKAKESMLSELNAEKSEASQSSLKRPNLDPSEPAKGREKLKKLDLSQEQASTSTNQDDTEKEMSSDAEDSFLCEDSWNEDEADLPSMALEYPPYITNNASTADDMAAEQSDEECEKGRPRKVNCFSSLDNVTEQNRQSSSETKTIQLDAYKADVNDDEKENDAAAAVTDSSCQQADQKVESTRLENMLLSLTKSVADLHTKFDMVYTILTNQLPAAIPTAASLSNGSSSNPLPSQDDQKDAAIDPNTKNTDSHCVQLDKVDTSQPSHEAPVRAGESDIESPHEETNPPCKCEMESPDTDNKWDDAREGDAENCPVQYAINLADQRVGHEMLIQCTLTGEHNTKTIDDNVLAKIKGDVIKHFLADKPEKEQEQTWASCLQGIAKHCEDLRSKQEAEQAEANTMTLEMPVIVQVEGNSTHGNTDHDTGVVHVGGHPEVTIGVVEYHRMLRTSALPNLYTIALADRLYGIETLEKSTLTGFNNTASLDYDILTAIKDEVLGRFSADKTPDERRSLWLQCQNSIASRCKNLRYKKTLSKRYGIVGSPDSPLNTPASAGLSTSTDDATRMEASDWSMLESFERSTDDGSSGGIPSVGLRDFVAIGGNSNISITCDEYEDICSRKTQPTLFATALADKIFGRDVLKISTLTGKDKTNRLDVRVVDAIREEVLNRFVPDVSLDEKERVWVQCQQSVANRCKTLRFKDKTSKFHTSLRSHQLPTMVQRDLGPSHSTPSRPQANHMSVGATTPLVGQISTSVGRNEAAENEDLEDVMIGDDPNVTMSLADYKEVKRLEQPKPYALALTEKLFGRDVLSEASVDGRGNTPKLDQDILYSIKADVIEQFAADQSPAEQESLWSDCLLCIATKCRTLRFRADKPSIPTTSQKTSAEPIAIDLDSDNEQYSIIIGDEPGVTLTDAQYSEVSGFTRSNKFAIALAEMLFGAEKLASVKITNNPERSELDHTVLRAIKAEIIKRFGKGMTSEQQEKLWLDSFTSISLKCRTLRYARTKTREGDLNVSREAVRRAEAVSPRYITRGYENCTPSTSSRDSTDIEISPTFGGFVGDSNKVAIGNDPAVTLPSYKYTNLCRTSHPNKYTIALAENIFGKDTLAGSTVTGHGRTSKLDDRLLSAIKAEVISIFGADRSIAKQEQMWSSCLQSIAAKCKTLRYVRRHAHELLGNETMNSEMSNERCLDTGQDAEDVVVIIPELREDLLRHSWVPSEKPPSVLIGGFQDVTLPLDEFREVTLEIEPSNYATGLASRLFAQETHSGSLDKTGAKTLNENILKAIKAEVLGRFAAEKAPEEREAMWRTCVSAVMTHKSHWMKT